MRACRRFPFCPVGVQARLAAVAAESGVCVLEQDFLMWGGVERMARERGDLEAGSDAEPAPRGRRDNAHAGELIGVDVRRLVRVGSACAGAHSVCKRHTHSPMRTVTVRDRDHDRDRDRGRG